ncbi:MAG: response regulator [Alphaproteobacteria bacterium]
MDNNFQIEHISALLIEDLNGDAKAITQALNYSKISKTMDMTRASRLKEGLKILAENKIDVVLLDLSLPDAKGIKGVVELNNTYPMIPIIVLSDQSDEKIIVRALENGARKFLVKGECNGKVIKNAIYEVLSIKSVEEDA